MGHRLSKITTRTGDLGMTGLATGERIKKSHHRIQVIGEVDELNSHIGYLLTFILPDEIRKVLIETQHRLFELGAELCMPGHCRIGQEMILSLEVLSTALNKTLPPLKEFILPGGAPVVAFMHIVRAVCRRTERALVALQEMDSTVNPLSLIYLNRLSDLCFILSRHLNKVMGVNEQMWDPLTETQAKEGG
jgi:cob(I)alamin adenosyltransferase